MIATRQYIYLNFIEGHKRWGDHLKVGHSQRPYERFKHEKGVKRQTPLRCFSIGNIGRWEAFVVESRSLWDIDKHLQSLGFDVSKIKPTRERYLMRGGSGAAVVSFFHAMADQCQNNV